MPAASVLTESPQGDILLSPLIIALSSSCSRGHCTGEAINYLPCPTTAGWSQSLPHLWWCPTGHLLVLETLPSHGCLVSSELLPGQLWRRTLPQVQMTHFWVWIFQLQISDLTSHRHLRFKTHLTIHSFPLGGHQSRDLATRLPSREEEVGPRTTTAQ